MAKLKFTKNELKTQRDALKRYRRFLPTLELKKQQLVEEIRRVEHVLADKQAADARVRNALAAWVQLFSEPVALEDHIALERIETREANIAGVIIPVFVTAQFRRDAYDLFATPLWIDRALDVIEELAALRLECGIIEQQRALLQRELRTTIQRINLFEKVKIPAALINIRVIQIYLGDQMANAVARGKIAKGKLTEAQMEVVA
jgi:V/A-type H+-transporting ATPase subunit D